jgi:phosphoribosyl 1,2-cyclic phosphodiesterase
MGLRFTVLASGSTGNAMVVAAGETMILVDAGLSTRKIEGLMQEQGISARELSAIYVTHEHSDHIKGLGSIARKYNLPIYANEKTWVELEGQIGEIEEHRKHILETGSSVEMDGLRIESYGISHDAVEPVGYCFYHRNQKLTLATDLGYMSSKVKEKLEGANAIVLETNHDVDMLRMGNYPWNIKRRILSDLGHLSNESAADGLCDVLSSRLKAVYMAHLSREHNMLDLARLTLNTTAQGRGVDFEEHGVRLMNTYPDRSTKWEVLDEA